MSDYENLSAGEWEGRLVYVCELGWHQDEYKGEKKKPTKKKALGIEVVDSDVEINGEKQPRLLWTRPFNTFGVLTEKGKEMEHYCVFDPQAQPGSEPDWESQLGKPCNVVVEHAKSKDGERTFDNIARLTPIPAKYQDKVTENRLTPSMDARDKLFGLAKWVYDQRLDDESEGKNVTVNFKDGSSETYTVHDDEKDFDDEIPF